MAPDRGEIGERAIILVSDSALTLVSGSKRNPKHTSPSDTFQAYLSSMVQPGYGEVRMEDKWGARLIHLVGRVEAIMDELIEATGDRFAAIDVMVVWSGNELVGSRGVFVNPDPYCREVRPDESWDEVHGAQGNIREIAGGIQRAFRVLAAIRRRPRAGFVSIVLGNNAPIYHLPIAFNELNEHFAAEALEAATARYYCSLKRLADYFIIGEHTEMVSQIHAGQMEGLSTAREINRTAAKPEAISREAANNSLNELDAIEDFYLSRMPANIAVPPLPAGLVRSAEEAQPARKPVEGQSAGGNPEPGP